MRFRALHPNNLTDASLPKQPDHCRTGNEGKKEGGDDSTCRPEGQVVEDVEDDVYICEPGEDVIEHLGLQTRPGTGLLKGILLSQSMAKVLLKPIDKGL